MRPKFIGGCQIKLRHLIESKFCVSVADIGQHSVIIDKLGNGRPLYICWLYSVAQTCYMPSTIHHLYSIPVPQSSFHSYSHTYLNTRIMKSACTAIHLYGNMTELMLCLLPVHTFLWPSPHDKLKYYSRTKGKKWHKYYYTYLTLHTCVPQ